MRESSVFEEGVRGAGLKEEGGGDLKSESSGQKGQGLLGPGEEFEL